MTVQLFSGTFPIVSTTNYKSHKVLAKNNTKFRASSTAPNNYRRTSLIADQGKDQCDRHYIS